MFAVRRHTIEEDISPDDVDANGAARAEQAGDHLVELAQLLRDHRVPRRIRSGQLPKTGQPPQNRQRIEVGVGAGVVIARDAPEP